MSLLLDIEEVRALVRGADYDGFTAYDLQSRLQMHGGTVRRLIAAGHLKTITVVNLVNRCPTVIVTTEEVERFEREFVSLFALARQQKRHHMAVKKELEAAGREAGDGPEEDRGGVLSEGGFRSDTGPAMNDSLGAKASIAGRIRNSCLKNNKNRLFSYMRCRNEDEILYRCHAGARKALV